MTKARLNNVLNKIVEEENLYHPKKEFWYLTKSFFSRNAKIVAKELIGKIICIESKNYIILEVEAYMPNDPYCLGVRNKETKNNSPQFHGEGCIFIHDPFGLAIDITTGKRKPQSVLIRKIASISADLKNFQFSDVITTNKITSKLRIKKTIMVEPVI